MQRPLQDHIAFLEQRIQLLKAKANDLGRTADERFQSTVDLGIAERALTHFRKAYVLEQEVTQEEPN